MAGDQDAQVLVPDPLRVAPERLERPGHQVAHSQDRHHLLRQQVGVPDQGVDHHGLRILKQDLPLARNGPLRQRDPVGEGDPLERLTDLLRRGPRLDALERGRAPSLDHPLHEGLEGFP
jgi:hypothetical protein